MTVSNRYQTRTLHGIVLSALLLVGGCALEAAAVDGTATSSATVEAAVPQDSGRNPEATAKTAAAVAPGAAKQGKHVYASVCARCHGVNMINTAASTFDLREFPLDQKSRFVQSVLHGKGAMPAWEGAVTPEEVEALWAYVGTRGAP